MTSNKNHSDNSTESTAMDSTTIATDKASFSATLGALMKSWRTANNRSVYSVAKATGLSAHTINRIESGRTVNLEAALRYLAFITRTDPKNHILRDYLAATKSIELTPRQPKGCPINEVSTTDNVAKQETSNIVQDAVTSEDDVSQDRNWISGIKNKIKDLFIP